MIRYLFKITQTNQRFEIHPHIGFQLAALAFLTLDRKMQLEPEAFQFGEPAKKSQLFAVKGLSGFESVHNVKVIRMHGVMTMSGDLCSWGMEDYDRLLKRAYADPQIHAVVLNVCSPGGESMYTETLAETVANAPKPVVAWINQMACSAAYRISAGADEILLSGPSAEVGSIGTLISYLDFTRYLRDNGVDVVQMIASRSKHKRKYNFHEPSEEDRKLIIEEYIDPSNELFIEQVKRLRPGMAEEVFDADIYMGDAALKVKLADGYATFEEAIEKAAMMAL